MSDSDTSQTGPRRTSRAVYVVIGIGVAFAAITVGSGLAGSHIGWHDDSEITREVFINIPTALKVAFYVLIPVMLVGGAVLFSQRVKNWGRGQPDNRATTAQNLKRRMEDMRAGLYMQTLFRDPVEGAMHSFIYFSFLVLLGVTTVLEVNHQLPENAKFLHGGVYQGYSFIGDLAGVTFLIGVKWAILRRYVARPVPDPPQDPARARSHPGYVRSVSGCTGFLAEGFRIAV